MYNKQLNSDLPAFVIISAELANNSAKDNVIRTENLKSELIERGYLIKEVQGSYKGKKEISFIVVPKEPDNTSMLIPLLKLANQYSQESILYVSPNRKATLIYADTGAVDLGQFKVIDESLANKLDGYTYDPDSGYYYAAY